MKIERYGNDKKKDLVDNFWQLNRFSFIIIKTTWNLNKFSFSIIKTTWKQLIYIIKYTKAEVWWKTVKDWNDSSC